MLDSWIGRIVDCVYGLDYGSKYIITSEPFNTSIRGSKSVNCVNVKSGEIIDISVEDLNGSIYYRLGKPKYGRNFIMVWKQSTRDAFSAYLRDVLGWKEYYQMIQRVHI